MSAYYEEIIELWNARKFSDAISYFSQWVSKGFLVQEEIENFNQNLATFWELVEVECEENPEVMFSLYEMLKKARNWDDQALCKNLKISWKAIGLRRRALECFMSFFPEWLYNLLGMSAKMIMRKWGVLRGKEDNLVRDLKKTTLSCMKLGERYGVSREAVRAFSKRQGIKRPWKPKGHQIEECRLCQKLIQISKKPHSEFISNHTIVKESGESRGKYLYHLRMLKDIGLVSQRFGRLRSMRAEKAYAMYFTKQLPTLTIGRKVGLKNFPAVIGRHRKLGWNVPPSLYVYDERERSKIQREIQRRKQ